MERTAIENRASAPRRSDPPSRPAPRILLVAYAFPPDGGGGVQRPAKLVKAWVRAGVPVAVLAAESGVAGATDPELLRDVRGLDTLVRAPDLGPWRWLRRRRRGDPPGALGKLIDRAAGAALALITPISLPDLSHAWLPAAFARGVALARRFRPDLILATGPPFTSFLVGVLLARATGRPLVLDYRDPWMATYLPVRFSAASRLVSPGLERLALRHASGVVAAHRAVFAQLRERWPGIDLPRRLWVPNGFDPDDFPSPAEAPADPRRFVLNYAGSLYDFRDPGPLLAALDSLLAAGTIDPQRFRFRLAGQANPTTARGRLPERLAAVVEHSGYISHDATVRRLQSSTVNLVLEGVTGERNHHSPGKFYEVLYAGRPVLLLCPEGTTTVLARRARGCSIGHPQDVEGIRHNVAALYDAWSSGAPLAGPEPVRVRFYDRGLQAERLLRFLERVAAR